MRIAVAGYGVEGRANYSYWANLGYEIDILDENEHVVDIPIGAKAVLGSDAYESLEQYDFVVRTAGLNPNKLHSASKIWSATNEFFAQCPAPIIGVTGSKGKGTTSSIVASILRADGRNVHLVGNIGVPALQSLGEMSPEDVVVYEMSSFQLWDIEYSPKVAVILHIEPDHLDVHSSFEEYVSAKANIARFQHDTDVTIVNPVNEHSMQIASARQDASRIVRYGDSGQDTEIPYSYADDKNFLYGAGQSRGEVICPLEKLQLPGAHNIENANAAISAALQFDASADAIAAGLESFKGLDHRLKIVGEVEGVKYYDDSIATTPGSAIAAVRAFAEPKVLILGGSSKGADFSELASVIEKSNTKLVVLIGAEAKRIARAFVEVGLSDDRMLILGESNTMDDAVRLISERASSGDVVLLSPACASFGQFKNYQDRGDQFIAAVKSLSGGSNESA